MLRFMSKDYEKYRELVESCNALHDEGKTKELLDRIDIIAAKKQNVILNSYHLSNLIGIKWNYLKAIIKKPEKYYHNFYILKKTGGKRQINVPNEGLATCQKYIKENILDKINIHECANGFANSRSIITNAQKHINKEVILNIDLKDFFPSINSKKIFYVFNKLCGYDSNISYCLTKLVMYKGGLPQGACTSPVLSNIVSYKMDIRLSKLAEKLDIAYTRYADDITFSGNKNVINNNLLSIVTKIIEECGYKINDKKTRFQTKNSRQEVTGLIVNNGKVSIPKQYIKKIRQELYYIEKYGIINHKQYTNIYNKFYKEHIKGKIMFVYSIDKKYGQQLIQKYNELFE